MKRLLFTLPLLAALMCAIVARAATVDADPNKDYPLTPLSGQWLILATCYVGPQAPDLARKMVYELRSKHNVPAYVLNKGEEERRKLREEMDKLHQMYGDIKGIRHTRVQDQCAVVIGGYKDMASANKDLNRIRGFSIQNDELKPILTTMVKDDNDQVKGGNSRVSPFVNSFVVRNTTLPLEKPRDDKTNALIRKLNAGEKYSVFQCRKPFTLVVATFQGVSIIETEKQDAGFFDKLMRSSRGQGLSVSAQNAIELCGALRQSKSLKESNYDAYVMHTTWGSVVCIGEFDSPEDPSLERAKSVMARFQVKGGSSMFMQNPLPMPIPRD